MSSKGKKLSIVLAIFMSLIFVLGVFFSSFLDKDSDKCEHDWSFFKTLTNVSCDTDGIMLVYCSRCSNFEQRVIPAIGHSLVQGSAATYPTCTESGVTASSVCSTCNKVVKYPEPISALGHNPVVVPGKPGTCIVEGLSDGTICSRCNTVILEQKLIYGDCVDNDANGICDNCGFFYAGSNTIVEVPVEVGEKIVGKTYRLYHTSFNNGLILSNDADICFFFYTDLGYPAYIFSNGPYYCINGFKIRYGEGYMDITFNVGTFDVVRYDDGTVLKSYTITEDTTVASCNDAIVRLDVK